MGKNGTVLIIDDDLKVLESLERLLRLHGYSVHTFSSSASVLAHGHPSGPCCALVDVRMPGFNGADLQSWFARAYPGLPVILITGYGDIPQAVRAIKGGAADFLTKPIEENRLLRSVRRALAQQQELRVEEEARALYKKRFATLTPRERQVCAFVVEGKLNKQIAAELGTCEKTIKVHRGRVMKKMKVQSLAELVRVILVAGETSDTTVSPPAVETNASQPEVPRPPLTRTQPLS